MLLDWRILQYTFHLIDSWGAKNPTEPPTSVGLTYFPFFLLLRYFFLTKSSYSNLLGSLVFLAEPSLRTICGLISAYFTQASFSKKWCHCLQRMVNHLLPVLSILVQIAVGSLSWINVLLPNSAVLTFSSCCCPSVSDRYTIQTVTKCAVGS